MLHKIQGDFQVQASCDKRSGLSSSATRSTLYRLECYRADGSLKWVEEFNNLVTNEGLNDSLDKHFKASGYIAAWYVGLINNSPTPSLNAADTMASHSGWAEVTAYSGSTRPTLTLGSVSNQSVSNSGSAASFTGTTDGTVVAGAFLTTGSSKGGTTGILYSVGTLPVNKDLDNGDTLNVSVTLSASAS